MRKDGEIILYRGLPREMLVPSRSHLAMSECVFEGVNHRAARKELGEWNGGELSLRPTDRLEDASHGPNYCKSRDSCCHLSSGPSLSPLTPLLQLNSTDNHSHRGTNSNNC
jgi:hypothetical protein